MPTLDDFIGKPVSKKKSSVLEDKPAKVSVAKEHSVSHDESVSVKVAPKEVMIQSVPVVKMMTTNSVLIPWTKKYAPTVFGDLVGQEKAFLKVKDYLDNYSKQKKKAILLYGPSGIGKTSCVYGLFHDEIIELNSSDDRNKEVMDLKLGNALQQKSLFSENKLILVDDLEGFSGFYDKGGIAQMVKLIEESTFPIVMTCQDPFDKKFSGLRSKCVMLEFSSLSKEDIAKKIKYIYDAEKISYDDKAIGIIAEFAQGDLRAAINDAQMLSMGNAIVNSDLLNEMEKRIQKGDMRDALAKIFKGTTSAEVLDAFDNLDFGFDDHILWIDYNMPLEYEKKADRARAYGCITKSDVFLKRIMKRQHWRFLVYVNALLTAGIATSKESPYYSKHEYQQTSRIFKIWQSNMKFAKRKSIAAKIAEKVHCSLKDVVKDFHYYKLMINKNEGIAQELDLDDEEKEFLAKV